MRNALVLLAAGLLVVLAPRPAAGDKAPDPRRADLAPGERLPALVERVRWEHARLQTLEADFRQLKESELLLEPVEARGVFSYEAPDRVRWEYVGAEPISLLIDGDQMTTWYRDLDQAERIDVGRHSQRILEYLGAGSSMARLMEYFDVVLRTPGDGSLPYHLELEPRYARVARRLRRMDVWIHPELFLPSRLRYVEADGDVTEYVFTNMRVNAGLPAGRFELTLPERVKVRELEIDGRPSPAGE